MKSLSTKYLELIKGKYTRKQFLAEVRRELPNIVTSHNSFKDAIKVLKGKGFLSIDKTLQSVEELCNEHTILKSFFTEGRSNPQEIKSISNTKDRITLVTKDSKVHIFDILQGSLFENTSPAEYVKLKRDQYLKEMVSEYPFTLTAIQKGIRYELKEKGLTTSSKLPDKDWDKLRDKVVKNLMKDSTYYIHKKAGTKPTKEKDRTDLTKEVPDVDREKIDKKATQKKVKDKDNQMKEVPLNEVKEAVKKLIINSLNEQEYSMPGPDFKEGHRSLVNMLDKVVNIAETVGQAAEQERDALADDPNASDYLHEVVEYLRMIYNGYLYADRNAGRDDEIFKEDILKEELSDEAYQKMEGMSNLKAQEAVKKGSGIILRELTEDGFDETEVLDFLQVLIKTNYGIFTETQTVNASKKRTYEDASPFEKNIQDLEEAELLLQQVIELITWGVKGTNQEAHANAYIIPHLESWLNPNSSETSISEYIEYLKAGDLNEATVNEQDLTPIQALEQTPAFERALRSEDSFAGFIKRVEGDLWNYMASHFDNRAGSAPDELEEYSENVKIDYSEYITKDSSGALYIDTEDLETGEKIAKPGDKIHFTYGNKDYSAIVTDKAAGRDDDNLMLALVAK